MDRTTVIQEMYQGYLDAHDLLVAGTKPSEVPELAAFSARLDEDTVFTFQSLDLEVLGLRRLTRHKPLGVPLLAPGPSAEGAST